MQLKKLMIEVMVFFVLGCFLCACGKTKDQTRKTTKDANKEIMIGGDNYPPFNYTDENGNLENRCRICKRSLSSYGL